jgi:hypothetical protein
MPKLNLNGSTGTGLLAIVLAAAGVSLVAENPHPDPAGDFQHEIRPILEQHCYECHGLEKHKADLNLASFTNYTAVAAAPDTWQRVLERVQAFEMPPKGKPELDFSKHEKLMKWLRELPRPGEGDCDQLASDRNTSFYRGYVMSRRLNRAEYNCTIRDLIGLDLHLDDLLPADGGGGEGFDTTGNALFTSSIHLEKYLAAAEQVLATALPTSAPSSPALAKARRRILMSEPSACTPARQAAREVVETFAHRAFRRPVQHDEVERLLTLFDRAWQRGDGFVPAVRLALKAVLVSPDFLFLAEPEPAEGGVQELGALPLASKLSYFLWSSMPDDELLALAENGDLLNDFVYRDQIHRMLTDPKAEALGQRFALQWLDLERLGSDVRPDSKTFPQFDADLAAAMRAEVSEFFNDLLRNDRSLLGLIDINYTFVNQRLAQLYGIEGVSGSGLERVQLHDPNRGGVIGMAAIAAVTSYPVRTSPVLRGRWILESLLGDKVPPPPSDVPALDQSTPQVAQLTLRGQLEAHRSKAECASCHDKMDPLGFSLENFDVLGRWRSTDHNQPIDAKGVLPSGEAFTGPAGLKAILLKRKDDVMRHLVRKMAGFAFGRELNQFDECVVTRTLEALKANNYRASILIEQIATSFPFRHRFYPKQT